MSAVLSTEHQSKQMRRLILQFGGLPLLGVISPLVVLPLVARVSGTSGWAAIGVGQSIGAVAAIIVGYGWSLSGPVEIAKAPRDQWNKIWYEYLSTVTLLCVATAPLLAIALCFLVQSSQLSLALLIAFSALLNTFSPTWLAIGAGKASWIAIFDAAPRFISSILAVMLVSVFHSPIPYAIVGLVVPIAATAAFSVLVVRPQRAAGSISVVFRRLATDAPAALTASAGSMYSAGVLMIATLTTSSREIAHLSSADRLFRYSTVAIVVLTNALQAWVVVEDPKLRRHRIHRSVTMYLILGIIGGFAFAGLGHISTGVLFGNAVSANPETCAAYGVAFLALCANTVIGRHILLVTRGIRDVARSTLWGAAIGIPAIAWGASLAGAVGGAAGFAASECVVIAVQLFALVARRKGC